METIEVGEDEQLSLEQVKDFDGPDGLWADLQTDAPNLSFIVPNQCHDMHGFVSGGTPICSTSTAVTTPRPSTNASTVSPATSGHRFRGFDDGDSDGDGGRS